MKETEWRTVAGSQPPPHAKYLVKRDGVLYTATPCYGMHSPWWVGRVLGAHESEPTGMRPDDEWQPL